MSDSTALVLDLGWIEHQGFGKSVSRVQWRSRQSIQMNMEFNGSRSRKEFARRKAFLYDALSSQLVTVVISFLFLINSEL